MMYEDILTYHADIKNLCKGDLIKVRDIKGIYVGFLRDSVYSKIQQYEIQYGLHRTGSTLMPISFAKFERDILSKLAIYLYDDLDKGVYSSFYENPRRVFQNEFIYQYKVEEEKRDSWLLSNMLYDTTLTDYICYSDIKEVLKQGYLEYVKGEYSRW